jgi:hypothetical protein
VPDGTVKVAPLATVKSVYWLFTVFNGVFEDIVAAPAELSP